MAKLNCHADLEADSDLSWLQQEMHSLMAENLFVNAAEDNVFGALMGLPGGMPGNLNLLGVNGADMFAQRDVNMNMGGDMNICSDNLAGWSGIGAASAFGLPTFPSDPAFAERAAKYSSFAKGNGSNPSKAEESAPSTATSGNSKDGPSDFAASGKDAKSAVKKKRKTLPSSKAVNSETAKGKRCKGIDSAKDNVQDSKSKAEQSKQSNDNCAESAQKKIEDDEDSKAPAPPEKPNYIHVRARRGQATDSHSLAERVRREKISERMKLLQDLVPGCNKITGKALMLDEIINHVQSLQRQVEVHSTFLSMKLATVNPRLDFDMDNFIAKEMMKSCPRTPSNGGITPELTAPSPYLQYQKPSLIQAVAGLTFTDVSAAWDAQFNNMFNLGFQPGRTEPAFESQAIPGNFSLNHAMKREL